ncbi:MAG: gliding motility protein GldN [Dysgonamonadaceae bacterium]|jgi:gliding motility associated protien GldN|nr:gliding motility protein GldN [Dysgonamonadaceae bacterium]
MKAIYFISLFFLLLAFVPESFSQDQPPQRRTRQRASEVASDNTPSLTERARIKNEESSKAPSHIVWQREIYRNIYLDKENNSPLYYPTQPIGKRVNLFTLLFKLLSENKITAYNYLDGREIFTEEEKINFEEILKKYQILYTAQGSGDNIKYIVNEIDIPGSEVLIYLIKEGWYFDAATGTFKSQVIAICPMLVRTDFYSGERTRDPMFWLPYEEIRPYLSRELIMTSNYNNALTYTMDDFFSKKMYSGEIVKTTNLMNLSLAQQVGADPDTLKIAQDSIENQLKSFNKNLWVYNDTIPVAAAEETAKPDKKTTPSKEKTSGRGAKKEKEEKPKAATPKAEKSSSAPARSVRRR